MNIYNTHIFIIIKLLNQSYLNEVFRDKMNIKVLRMLNIEMLRLVYITLMFLLLLLKY